MSIDWTTVIFEMINFALLVLIALRFVFRPVRNILDQRKAELLARATETLEREEAAALLRIRYEGELARIDALAEQRVNAALNEARSAADEIVSEARTAARGELDKAAAERSNARRRALERFRGEILQLGTEAARRLVGELDCPDIGLGFARRAIHALEDAVGNNRGAPLTVRHSPDIDPDALERLLRRELGADLKIQLRVDESLIGGVRLDSEGHEIEASAGASLDDWYRSLAGAAA